MSAEPRPNRATLLALSDALVREPLFHVSLGSKELFHSNLLAWMCERFPEEARRVLAPWLAVPDAPTPTRTRVRREYKHLDLVIEFEGFVPLVIENKMFALPDAEQLRRYAKEGIGSVSSVPTFVLLSLTDPMWPDDQLVVEGGIWDFVSYGDLAERLRGEFRDAADFDGQVLAHEAVLAQLLHDVATELSIAGGNDMLRLLPPTIELLEGAHLADMAGKMRAFQTMQGVRSQIAEERLEPTRTEVGFSNGQPLLAAFWLDANGDGVGWQFQGNQWRLAVISSTHSGRTAAKAEDRTAYARAHIDWFDFTAMPDLLSCTDAELLVTRARTPLDGFNKYDPDFVYRYRLLPAITVGQFTGLAMHYSRAARAWLDRHGSR